MRKNRRDNGTEAVQEDPGNDAEKDNRTAEVSTDASEGERAGTESLQQKVDNVTEAMQEAEGAEQTGQIAETSRDAGERAARVGTEIFQRNVDTVQKALQSSSVVAEVTQSISREWLNFTRECMEQNLNQFESLLRCRTPQDIAAVQSKILRDSLERFLQFARRIANDADARRSKQEGDRSGKGRPGGLSFILQGTLNSKAARTQCCGWLFCFWHCNCTSSHSVTSDEFRSKGLCRTFRSDQHFVGNGFGYKADGE